jgi:hypothetical protein
MEVLALIFVQSDRIAALAQRFRTLAGRSGKVQGGKGI